MMKKIVTVIAMAAMVCSGTYAQKRVSILGDSYSTYGGICQPEWNLTWYNGNDGGGYLNNDVKTPEQTWWMQLIDDMGWTLERNNSFSGSTICCSGYNDRDFSDRAFLSRVNDLGDPELIIILGGTNDSWAKSPIGEYQYADWTKKDLYNFRPAFAYLLERLTTLYPGVQIINVVNSQLSDEITKSQAEICEHYGITNIQLHDIDKQAGHPSVQGMKAIADQIKAHF